MRAKDYLLQIRKIDRMITNKIAEVEHWKAVALGAGTYSEGDRVQSSGGKDKLSDAVCRYMVLEEQLNEEIDRLIDTKREITATIEQLNPSEYDLLHRLYIQQKNLQEVAADMGKSYSWARGTHGTALYNLQRILNERGKTHDGQKDY